KKLRHATGDTSREPRNCRAFQFANKSFRQCKRKHTPSRRCSLLKAQTRTQEISRNVVVKALSRSIEPTERAARVDARSWPGSRRLAAASKLASSSQSAWLGASSLLRGLETPKRTHRHIAQPSEREGFFWRLVSSRKTLPDIWQLAEP
ncbi:hypothetical protein ALC60_08817, partial [Trachymyrmex zeteki]